MFNMIIIDKDEWRMSAVSTHLKKANNDGLIFARTEDMQNPDYLIANKVGVERATMNDLVQKIKGRTLEGQLQRVIDKGYEPIALVEGIIPSHSEMRLESIYGYISGLSESGITVVHTVNAEHTAQHLVKLHDKVMKGEFKTLKIPVTRSLSDHPTLKKLMGIEGIDETLAERIKLKYPNIVRFTWACQRQVETGRSNLLDINGIGKKKADIIAKSWLEEWK